MPFIKITKKFQLTSLASKRSPGIVDRSASRKERSVLPVGELWILRGLAAVSSGRG